MSSSTHAPAAFAGVFLGNQTGVHAVNLVEENMMGWIIESNHLVDALLARAGDTDEVVAIMQRRYDAAYQTVLALRQHIDGLQAEAAELRIHIAQQQRWLDELDKAAQEPA